MSPVLFVCGAIVVGIAIGWVLATQINDLAWRKLAEIQKKTSESQRNAIRHMEKAIKLDDALAIERDGIKKHWEEAVAARESAIAAHASAMKILDEANATKDESIRSLAEAVEIREQALRESREQKQQS